MDGEAEKSRKSLLRWWGPFGLLFGIGCIYLVYSDNGLQNGSAQVGFFSGLIVSFLILYATIKNRNYHSEKTQSSHIPRFIVIVALAATIATPFLYYLQIGSFSFKYFFVSLGGVLFILCSIIAWFIALFKKGMFQQ